MDYQENFEIEYALIDGLVAQANLILFRGFIVIDRKIIFV